MAINNCNIVKDLIPLCIDGVASEDSMQYVEEHIKTCEDCRHQMELMKKSIAVPEEKELRMKEAEGLKKMKKSIRNGIIIAICVTLLVSFGGFVAYTIGRKVTQQKNETNIVGVWKENGVEMISFNSNGKAEISSAFPLEETGLSEGEAIYYFSDPEVLRLGQGDDEDFSIEFIVKTSENHLSMYFYGEEFLELDK